MDGAGSGPWRSSKGTARNETRGKRTLRHVQRITRGVYATRTSVDWTYMSRGIIELRWVQYRLFLERTAHPVVQRRLRDRRMEWPISCSWPGRSLWRGMRHPPAEERNGALEETIFPSARRSGCLVFWDLSLDGGGSGSHRE